MLDVDGCKKQFNKKYTHNSSVEHVVEVAAKTRLFLSRQSHLRIFHTKNSIKKQFNKKYTHSSSVEHVVEVAAKTRLFLSRQSHLKILHTKNSILRLHVGPSQD